ncbi:MAG: dockerin type I domain-containing protein [Defluviitaleaceae bacterium]|nr:dockerin type I domain-containing protein [Defluviitaleaceae bacterium]MCL2262969.1 dockerin type I domain-containing protein [Defluviitaleaceae bacterium]
MRDYFKRIACLFLVFTMVVGLLHVHSQNGDYLLGNAPTVCDDVHGLGEFASTTPPALGFTEYENVMPLNIGGHEVVWQLDVNRLNTGESEVGAGSADRVLIGGTLAAPTYAPGFRLRNSGTPTSGWISAVHGTNPRVEVRYANTNRFIEIETGTEVGGTNAARSAADGFFPIAGETYRLVFNASMAAGTGGFRIRANGGNNNNDSAPGVFQRVTGLNQTPQTISIQWTQEANGGNIVLCNGNANNGMEPAPSATSHRTLILSNMRIYHIVPCDRTGYLFQLQEYIADMPLGCMGTGSTHIAPSHGLSEVTVEIVQGGTPGSRRLIVDRTAANRSRGLLLRGMEFQTGDIITVTGRLNVGAGLRMRFMSDSATTYTAESSMPGGPGSFNFSYTVSDTHAGRVNQNLRIVPMAIGSPANAGDIPAQFHIDNLTVFRPETGIPEVRVQNPDMQGVFQIQSPYEAVCWDNWFQFRASHHTHTRRSDGRGWMRETVVDHFNRGYDILAITDHSVVCTGDWAVNPPITPPHLDWWQPMQWNDPRNNMSELDRDAILDGTWSPGLAGRVLPTVSEGTAAGGRTPILAHEASHFAVTHGWMRPQMRDILGLPPGQPNIGMLPVPMSSEPSYAHHDILTYWFNYTPNYGRSETWIFNRVEELGGLAVLPHIGRYTCFHTPRCPLSGGSMCQHAGGRGHIAASNMPREVNRYVDWFRRFPALIGMEAFNRADGETQSDRILWDNILLQLMPEGIPVWGFANDDSHAMNHTGLGWNMMLMPSLTDENHRTSMETGAFYMVSRIHRGLGVNEERSTSAGNSWHFPLHTRQAPAIHRIAVDGQRITIDGVNYDEIIWITGNPFRAQGSINQGGGVIIETGNTIDLSQVGRYVWGNYIRAVLICRTPHGININSHGVALTQPFGIFVCTETPPPPCITCGVSPCICPPPETLTGVTLPVAPTLTEAQSANANAVIAALPTSTTVTTNTGETNSLPLSWVLRAGTSFSPAPGATNQFTWTLNRGTILPGSVAQSGHITVTNYLPAPPAPISVTVTPENNATTIMRGETLQFRATVYPSGAPQDVIWSLPLFVCLSITIDASGLLTVGSFAATNITVDVYATAAGTDIFGVSAVDVIPVIPTSITVTAQSGATRVTQGETLQFSAAVAPSHAPQNVVWGIFPPVVGASISGTGLLNVGAEVPANTVINVRATAIGTDIFDTKAITVDAITPDEILHHIVPPVPPTLTQEQSANLHTVISALPHYADVATNLGENVLPLSWTLLAGWTFNPAPGAENQFTWTLHLGNILQGNTTPTGAISVSNYGTFVPPNCPFLCNEDACCPHCGFVYENCNVYGCCPQFPYPPLAPALSVSRGVAKPGEYVTVQIHLGNNPGFANMELRMDFPATLTLLDSQTTAHFSSLDASGSAIWRWENGSSNIYEQGAVLTMTFQICPYEPLGLLPITATFISPPVNNVGETLNFQIYNNIVRVGAFVHGDVNGDGRVTSADATRLARWIAGQDALIDPYAADLCGNGITPFTVTLLARWLAGHNVRALMNF